MFNFRGKSNAAQITRSFTLMMILIVFITGASISLVVGYRLTRDRIDDARALTKSLDRSIIDDEPDWNRWAINSPINTKNTFVKVHTKMPKRKQQTFYSKGTAKFLKSRATEMPLFHSVWYISGHGLFYRAAMDSGHIYYETWTSFHDVLHIFRLILEMMVIVLILCGVLGYFVIAWLARRLNKPLANLTSAANKINHSDNVSYHEALPVPTSPDEVHALGMEINQLLKSLNDQVLRDHQFVSDASHELRTPLTAIRGHISLIKRRGDQHPEIIPKSLKFIDDESARMQTLVESLLRLSRMDHVTIDQQLLDINQLVQETVENYQPSIVQPVQVDVSATPLMTTVNADSLQQMLIALLNNASKYSPTDQPIQVAAQLIQDQPTITITDNGAGIDDADKTHIFERFYRVDQARSQEIPGTGLGLAIVSRLADLNQIKVTVSDHQPTGTIFTLTFKIKH